MKTKYLLLLSGLLVLLSGCGKLIYDYRPPKIGRRSLRNSLYFPPSLRLVFMFLKPNYIVKTGFILKRFPSHWLDWRRQVPRKNLYACSIYVRLLV